MAEEAYHLHHQGAAEEVVVEVLRQRVVMEVEVARSRLVQKVAAEQPLVELVLVSTLTMVKEVHSRPELLVVMKAEGEEQVCLSVVAVVPDLWTAVLVVRCWRASRRKEEARRIYDLLYRLRP